MSKTTTIDVFINILIFLPEIRYQMDEIDEYRVLLEILRKRPVSEDVDSKLNSKEKELLNAIEGKTSWQMAY